jgi:hypothetical protein
VATVDAGARNIHNHKLMTISLTGRGENMVEEEQELREPDLGQPVVYEFLFKSSGVTNLEIKKQVCLDRSYPCGGTHVLESARRELYSIHVKNMYVATITRLWDGKVHTVKA